MLAVSRVFLLVHTSSVVVNKKSGHLVLVVTEAATPFFVVINFDILSDKSLLTRLEIVAKNISANMAEVCDLYKYFRFPITHLSASIRIL